MKKFIILNRFILIYYKIDRRTHILDTDKAIIRRCHNWGMKRAKSGVLDKTDYSSPEYELKRYRFHYFTHGDLTIREYMNFKSGFDEQIVIQLRHAALPNPHINENVFKEL